MQTTSVKTVVKRDFNHAPFISSYDDKYARSRIGNTFSLTDLIMPFVKP